MKKGISVLAIVVSMVSMMSVTAFAHGGHGHGKRANPRTQYALCTVEGCTELGLHQHNGTYYYCQSHGTGIGCGKGRNR